jgi:hypothetical protein
MAFNFPSYDMQQLYLFVLQLYFVKESFIHFVAGITTNIKCLTHPNSSN